MDLCNRLKQRYEIVAIQALETETVIELKCFFVPTTEFIKNGAFPELLRRILERDPLWKIFPPSYISSISLEVTVVTENLGNTYRQIILSYV